MEIMRRRGVVASVAVLGVAAAALQGARSGFLEADKDAYHLQMPITSDGFRPALLHIVGAPEAAASRTTTTRFIKTCSGKFIKETLDPSVNPLYETNTDKCVSDAALKAVKTAIAIAADPHGAAYKKACQDPSDNRPDSLGCASYCLHLVAAAYGWNDSGYDSAKAMATAMDKKGLLHKDRRPQIGDLLFLNTGAHGHVEMYMGEVDGKSVVFTNDVRDAETGRTGGAYIAFASEPEDLWSGDYIGHSGPHFRKLRHHPVYN